jgi:hypothetical protein
MQARSVGPFGLVDHMRPHVPHSARVCIDPAARAAAIEPATLLWHKPAGVDPRSADRSNF